MSTEFRICSMRQGRRLDAALAAFFPLLGLRGRRRLWEGHQVLVDGAARSPAFKVHGNELIKLVRNVERLPAYAAEHMREAPRCLARAGQIFFLYKPSGLHTEALAGKNVPSLAALIAEILPDVAPLPTLLTRLDWETSGIVLAAGQEAVLRLRAAENAGKIEKQYLAVLEGRLNDDITVRNALDTAGKKRVRALEAKTGALRHTQVRPLCFLSAAELPTLTPAYAEEVPLTLALCRIHKGARHQIRVHAALIGHPLAGDYLYGAQARSVFYLHHTRLNMPDGQICCLPSWVHGLAFSEQNLLSVIGT